MHWKVINWATKYAEGFSINMSCLYFPGPAMFPEFAHMQHMHDKCKLRTFCIFLMASWLVTCYEKMISSVHKAFLAHWQLLEYICKCCLLNLTSQSGNYGVK
jgi:hypothetical protein